MWIATASHPISLSLSLSLSMGLSLNLSLSLTLNLDIYSIHTALTQSINEALIVEGWVHEELPEI